MDITKRQREILEILWERGEATSAEISANLPDAPTSSTVRSLLQIMTERGLILDDGSSYRKRYKAAIDREEVDNEALPELLSQRYSGSVEALLDDLVKRDLLDIESLERALEKMGKERDTPSKERTERIIVTTYEAGSRKTPRGAGALIAGGVAFGIGLLLGRR